MDYQINLYMKYTHEDGTPFTKEEFLEKLKTDKDFSNRYGRKHITEEKMVLPPCHYGFQVYTRELSMKERWEWLRKKCWGKSQILWDRMGFPSHEWMDKAAVVYGLEQPIDFGKVVEINVPRRAISLMWNQRSVDTPLGLPFNISSYGLLLEILAKMVNMVPDELIGNLGDTHIYSNQIEGVKEQITREPYPLPKLTFMKTDEFFKELGNDLSLITHLDNTDFKVEGYISHPTIKFPLSN